MICLISRQNSPIPCTLLGQLAVNARYQGKSAGALLLQDAIKCAARASMVVASRALIVDPGDERAEGFYQHFGFRRLSDKSRRMFLPLLFSVPLPMALTIMCRYPLTLLRDASEKKMRKV